MSGDPGEVDAAGAVLDHDEDVEASQEDGVDVGEVDGEDCAGLCGQELSPGRSGLSGSGVDASGVEDLPHGGGGDVLAEPDELALDASVAPAGVLSSHPQYQSVDGFRSGWAAGSASRVGPAAGDEPQSTQACRQQSAQRAEDGAVNPCQRRAGAVSTQHGDLVTEREDLGVLGCVGPREQCRPAQYTGEQKVGESEGHSGRSCWAGCGS
jgi:hypothetical protein